jgi:hypothetical protein
VFTPADREKVRNQVLAFAREDARISGAAVTGSVTRGAQDAWSDVDLAFGVSPSATVHEVVEDWTAMMYRDHTAVHHFDVLMGAWVYRVFLLRNLLQVDLAFAPADKFGARAPSFRLMFGDAVALPAPRPATAEDVLGLGWMYALHAVRCIARGRRWQAELMISELRGEVMKLACLRYGLPTGEGRGLDALPASMTKGLEAALATSLEFDELRRASKVAIESLIAEARLVDVALAGRIEPILRELLPG